MNSATSIPTLNTPTQAVENSSLPGQLRVGAVDYLNTLPLVQGLERLEGLSVTSTPPAGQIELLLAGEVDLALCSVIDLAHADCALEIVDVGMLGCAGETMTVRLFSRVPLAAIATVGCDVESHTSVELLRVILRECHANEPTFVPFDAKEQMNDTDALDAVLIIGDKVITQSLDASLLQHQLDLGEAWFNLTGLPFVFATWLCHADAGDAKRAAIASAARIIERTRLRNAIRLPQIAARAAAEHGWPVDVAQRYFTKCLRFELDSDARRGLRRFFDLVGGETALARLRYFESA